MTTVTQLATGLGGAIGCDLQPSQHRLLFVEFDGKLSALNLVPTTAIVSSGTTTLKGTFTFDLDTGLEGGVGPAFDIWWEQQTAVLRQMAPLNNAKIVNIGVVDFLSITPQTLQGLTYSTTPITGNNDPSNKLVPGDVFAVITNQGNYAKVKVISYGYNLQIQWATYHFNPAYVVLGTGYQQPEDVKLSNDNVNVYITERTGNLLRVGLGAPNRASATVISTGMTAPQQIALDEAHSAAYVVEYAPSGRLLRIDLTTGTKTPILSNLNQPVGLLISQDLQYAYISEQTPGPDKGRISRYKLSDGSRTPLATGLTNPFFLTWSDASQTSMFVPERDPANRIGLLTVSSAALQSVVGATPVRPSSVAVTHPGEILVCSDQVIESVDFVLGSFKPNGPLLMGIGFIPFDKVTPSGLADTSVDPTYFYQVKDTPFGGALPLMINHYRAGLDGAAYYRVKVDGIVRMDSWSDYKWNGFQYVVQTTSPTTVNNQPGYYPVHPFGELFLWMNPSLGSIMDSTDLTNALHTIVVEFVDGGGLPKETSTPLTILVDNQRCVAALGTPTLKGSGANQCGVLKYTAKNNDLVIMPYVASHPKGFGTFEFELIKGVSLAIPVISGPVSAAASPVTATVATLLGSCDVAGYAELLYVWATANSGWSRQSQYDASAAIAFVLAP